MAAFSQPAQAVHTTVRAMARARKRLLAQVCSVGDEPDAQFAHAFVHLVTEIEAGLRQEEALMEAAGVPGLREQRRDNALLLNALHHALPRVEAGDLAIGRAAVGALRDLLSLHRFSSLRVLAAAQRAWRHRPVLPHGPPRRRPPW